MTEYLPCPACPAEIEVPPEDPDAALSDLWSHLGLHTYDRGEREQLFLEAQQAVPE